MANAVGAALSQVAGYVDRPISLQDTSREEAKQQAQQEATQKAIGLGADPQTIQAMIN